MPTRPLELEEVFLVGTRPTRTSREYKIRSLVEIILVSYFYLLIDPLLKLRSLDFWPSWGVSWFRHLGAQVDNMLTMVRSGGKCGIAYLGGSWTWGDAWLMSFNRLCMTNSSVRGRRIWNSKLYSFCISDLYVGISLKLNSYSLKLHFAKWAWRAHRRASSFDRCVCHSKLIAETHH